VTSDAISNRLLGYIDEIGGIERKEGDTRFIEVMGLMQPVATRPAVRIACVDGMYILRLVDGRLLNIGSFEVSKKFNGVVTGEKAGNINKHEVQLQDDGDAVAER
jgi:hypothetical protein